MNGWTNSREKHEFSVTQMSLQQLGVKVETHEIKQLLANNITLTLTLLYKVRESLFIFDLGR